MKKKLLFIAILSFVFSVSIIGQNRTDYSKVFIDGPGWNHINPSSTYWNGHTYIFSNFSGMNSSTLSASYYSMHENGSIHHEFTEQLIYNLPYDFEVSSCVYKKNLYAFYHINTQEIKYFERKIGGEWSNSHTIHIGETIVEQMAAVSYNDTLYMFFVDDADKYVKYYQIVYNEDESKLVLVSETPHIVNNTHTSIGNVAAITYVNNDLEEKIMLAYPGSYENRDNNDIIIYSGTPDDFSLFHKKACATGFSAWRISMAQGSIKGASTHSYNIQFGYTHFYDDSGVERCELNLKNNAFSDWEHIGTEGYVMGKATWFSEFYTKTTHKRQKYLLQGYNCGDGARAALWKSDILEYQDQKTEVPPINHKSKFFDVVLVVEGAPPYALNGYKLGDDIFNNSALSEFSITNEISNEFSTSTTYEQSIEANMGVGPVSAGFKASFMESQGTSHSKTITVTSPIYPSPSQADSSGLMWYYYIAPSVTRSRWLMQDYAGNTISPNRNLFFFTFHNPQLKRMVFDLSSFGDNSPRAYNLHSYENRGVENMNGMDVIERNETDLLIKAGGTGSLELTFSDSDTDNHDKSYEVSLGVDANYGIFSASASASASVEYSVERTSTCTNSFYINWNLFAPKVPSDTSNIRKYTAVSYLMKTTDSSAYYLLDGLKDFTPYFVTYEVYGIEKGEFLYSINENKIREKYHFINFPNPATNETNFKYLLNNKSQVTLTIFNSLGQKVNICINDVQNTGEHNFNLSTINFPSGIYYYRMFVDEDLISGKFIKK